VEGIVTARSGLVLTMLGPFVMATRECAMQMMANGQYVLAELPNVKMGDEARRRTRHACEALIGTKHDLITELFDLDDLVATDATDEQVGQRVERIVQWAHADVAKLCDVVAALDADSKRDPDIEIAHTLVMESAANVLQAYRPMQTASEAVLRAVQGVRLQGESPQ
jgi:hypothetical protein